MVRLYRDKITQKLTGDAIVAFEEQHAAEAAVEWINNTELNGNIVSVSVSEGAEFLNLVAPPSSIENPTTHVEPGYATDSYFAGDAGGCGVKCEGVLGDARGPVDLDGGKRKGRVDGKSWQQDGDWSCPNSRSVFCSGAEFLCTSGRSTCLFSWGCSYNLQVDFTLGGLRLLVLEVVALILLVSFEITKIGSSPRRLLEFSAFD